MQNKIISVLRDKNALSKTDSNYSLDEVSGIEMGLNNDEYRNLKQFSDDVGIASRHLVSILKFSHNLCISIRPVNPETKKSYYGNHGSGKMMDIKLKSANYGPIAGFIPLDHRLGKVAQIDMSPYEDEIRRHIEDDKVELEEILSSGSSKTSTDYKNYIGSVNFQITNDQGDKKDLLYATSASVEIVKDDDGNPIYFWEKENHSEGAKSKKEFFSLKIPTAMNFLRLMMICIKWSRSQAMKLNQ